MKKRINSFVRVCSPLGVLVLSCTIGSKSLTQKILHEHESLVEDSLRAPRSKSSRKSKAKKGRKSKTRKAVVICATFAIAKIGTRIDFQFVIDSFGIVLLEVFRGLFS